MFPLLELKQNLRKAVGDDFTHRTYVVAVSGGRDSMALLSGMLEVVSGRLVVGHFDHVTRGGESGRDAAFVADFCLRHGVEFKTARRRGKSLAEADLRKERWDFLKNLRLEVKADFIVTAHHLHDQLETFLMRLIRGTGIEGLAAMSIKDGRVLRPWLTLDQAAIEEWARVTAVPFREDATNRQPIYFRNRIRHELLPELFTLAESFGGERAFLARFAGLSRELAKYRRKARKKARRNFKKLGVSTPFWIRISAAQWQSQKQTKRANLLREIYRQLGAEMPGREKLEEMLLQLTHIKRKLTLPGGILVESSCGHLFFQSLEQREALAKIPSPRFQGGLLECPALGLEVELPKALVKLRPRFFKAGDRLGKKKLKELWLSARIPSPERRLLPVLSSRNSHEVAWYFPQKTPGVHVKSSSFPFSFDDAQH